MRARTLRRCLACLFVLLGLLVTACRPAPLPAVPGDRLKVVATFSVIGDLARSVGGDQIELLTLVGPGQDTHTFEPTPANARALTGAALIFENGLGFETWLDDLYTASASNARRVVVTEGIQTLTAGQPDPHAWHSVANAIQMVANIRQALAQADPDNAATYQANAEAYIAELQDLDAWIFGQVQTIPAPRRKLVTTHDTFGYFAARYGFEVLGSLLPTTTEGASPSAQQMAALVEAIQAADVPAVFAENVTSNSLLNQVASEAGVTVVASLYTDALGPTGSDGDSYVKMMRYNVSTVVTALVP